jgi:hypothetical protein
MGCQRCEIECATLDEAYGVLGCRARVAGIATQAKRAQWSGVVPLRKRIIFALDTKKRDDVRRSVHEELDRGLRANAVNTGAEERRKRTQRELSGEIVPGIIGDCGTKRLGQMPA